MHPGASTATETSTHQLVGYVTKMFPTFGYINNEIFFQKKCVIGPMVEIGDNVATSAVYQPNMPIKWSAEKVWKVQDSRHSRSHERTDEEARAEKARSPRNSVDGESLRSHEKAYDDRSEKRKERYPRKRSPSPVSRRSHSRGHSRRSVETNAVKRRRLSPESGSIHTSGSTYSQAITRRLLNMSFLLNARELLIPDLRYRFPSVLAPVDLYKVVCHWQYSFPLLKPFYPEGTSVYQILDSTKDSTEETNSDPKSDTGYYVNVLLLSMPQMTSLHEKTVVRAENMDRTRGSLRKYIQILASAKTDEGFKAIGGSWKAHLDGPDPAKDPRTLINTAIRVCKEQLMLDLSSCTHWHRFLEFRYGRTEGSTARPTSVLFPGADLWGRKYPNPGTDVTSSSKPFHEIVVYFLPDVWSIMPSAGEWPKVKKAFEVLSGRGQRLLFPLTTDLMKQAMDETTKIKTEQANQHTPGPKESADRSGDKGSELSCVETASPGLKNQSVTELSPKTPISRHIAQTRENNSTPVDNGDKSVLKTHEELNLSAMKVSELREQLKVRSLPADGIKVQLLTRLKAAIEKEAEEARKAEEERKQKEKEQEEQAAKELQAKRDEEERQQAAEAAVKNDSTADTTKAIIHLRNYPSLVIQSTLADCRVQNATLEELLEPKSSVNMDTRAYEMMFCAHTVLEMLHRDAIFIFFRAMVTAGDRGVQAKSPSKSTETQTGSKSEKNSVHPEEAIKCTVDVPLLFACTLLDINSRGFFHGYEAEGLIASLGLPVSRYQIRSLITKVADDGRIHYRSLTDAELTSTTVKSKITYSEIDDDEYLVELIRGGDAVLEEGVDSALPTGSVLVFHTSGSSSPLELNVSPSSGVLSEPSTIEFTHHLKCLEMDKIKLLKQMKNKTDEIVRLRSLTDQIPNLRKELEAITSNANELKRRLKHEREQMHAATRVLEQQLDNLDSSRVALRQAANRLRGRSDSSISMRKSTNTVSSSSTVEMKSSSNANRISTKTSTDPKSKTETEKQSTGEQSDNKSSGKPMETEDSVTTSCKSPMPATEPIKLSAKIEGETEKLVNGVSSENNTEIPPKDTESTVTV